MWTGNQSPCLRASVVNWLLAALFLLSPSLRADEPKKADLSLEQQQLRRDYERF